MYVKVNKQWVRKDIVDETDKVVADEGQTRRSLADFFKKKKNEINNAECSFHFARIIYLFIYHSYCFHLRTRRTAPLVWQMKNIPLKGVWFV